MTTRVAFLHGSLPIGGAERLVQSLATRMDRSQVEPVIMTLHGPGPVGEELAAAGVRCIDNLARSKWDLASGGRLRAACSRERIDVIYVTDSALPLFWAGVNRRRSLRPRLVVGFHSTGKISDPVQHFIANHTAFPVVDRFVALSDSHREWTVSHLGLDRGRIEVIVSGVDLVAFAPAADKAAVRASLGLPTDAPLAGIVAALRPEKNHALFIEIAARVHERLPRARFLIAGDGPERPVLESAIAARGLGDVVLMLGARRDVPQLWRALDVAVLTSHPLVETLPVTLLEALACGVPAVSTDVGSMRDVIVDGETGYLAPAGDATALATRLGDLLADATLRDPMGKSARAHAERHFDRDRMVGAYQDLFSRVANRSAGVGQ